MSRPEPSPAGASPAGARPAGPIPEKAAPRGAAAGSDYVLGTSEHELARLRLQDEVWRPISRELVQRAAPIAPRRCLDAGCGPGWGTELLRELVGPEGEVLALDESPRWIAAVEERIRERGWRNVRTRQARLEELELEPGSLDLVWMRWVLSFLPEPAAILARLARGLRPGGLLLVQDYNHEGISLFPESAGFRAVVRATRALYREHGGDTFVAGRLPRLFRQAGLATVELLPRVICGGPGSPAFRWADAFFPHHAGGHPGGMLERGLLTPEEHALFVREWDERRRDPDALFFSPIVVGAVARVVGAVARLDQEPSP